MNPFLKRRHLLHRHFVRAHGNPQNTWGQGRPTIVAPAVAAPKEGINHSCCLIHLITCGLREFPCCTLICFFLVTLNRSPHIIPIQIPHSLQACHICALLCPCYIKLGHTINEIVIILQNFYCACRRLIAVALLALLGYRYVCLPANCLSMPLLSILMRPTLRQNLLGSCLFQNNGRFASARASLAKYVSGHVTFCLYISTIKFLNN